MDDMYTRARRATTGRSVLSTMAALFLGASLAFWGVLHWQVLVTSVNIPQIIIAVCMTLIYAAALPLLLSMLVPTTPAGQMLQKTQWRTIGFPVIIACAGFLGWHARNLMLDWFYAQPHIRDAHLETAYTIAALIGFVVIPALAWVQVTPERWLAEIQQAHLVKKLELEQSGELAIIKARLLWAEQKAVVGYARLLPAEQKEVRDTMRGLLMGIADTQRSIARTVGIQGDLEHAIMGDDEIADTLHYVEQQLEKPAASMERALSLDDDQDRESDVRAIDKRQPAHVDSRLQSSNPREERDATRRHMTTGDDAYARAARRHYDVKPWTVKALATALELGETRARELKDAWLDQGIVAPANLGRWYFTERVEA